MKLHLFPDEFQELVTIVANEKHISESAVERDYYIVMMLQRLEKSDYAEKCVFKGGTSLSKCYPGSIERFSEDIDLTYLGIDEADNACERALKAIEKLMSLDAHTEKIGSERNKRNKSMYVWFGKPEDRVKLEIGSSVRPDPYSKRILKSYIQEFLEQRGFYEEVAKFELKAVEINVLNIERTFVDKVMAVKRHAICGSLNNKVRHIYDVTRLFVQPEVEGFLTDATKLKRLVRLTKETDAFYLEKRNIPEEYNPVGAYNFGAWKHCFDSTIRSIYESLHRNLLYTDEKQNFDEALNIFDSINKILENIGE